MIKVIDDECIRHFIAALLWRAVRDAQAGDRKARIWICSETGRDLGAAIGLDFATVDKVCYNDDAAQTPRRTAGNRAG